MKPACPSVIEAYALVPAVPAGYHPTAFTFSSRLQAEPQKPPLPPGALLQAAVTGARGRRRTPGAEQLKIEATAPAVARRATPGPPAMTKQQRRQLQATCDALAKAGLTAAPHPGGHSRSSSLGSARAEPLRPGTARSAGSGGSGTTLSHATTPSWRSRSFPPHYGTAAVPGSPGAADVLDTLEPLEENAVVRRLPPLPLEARWAAVGKRSLLAPASELQRLKSIDPDVDEANAMLVESFLNVKRSLTSEVPDSEAQHQLPSESAPALSDYSGSKRPSCAQGSEYFVMPLGKSHTSSSYRSQLLGQQVLSGVPPALSARGAISAR
eukprot:TRINITY_DN97515_c0_g1_i1.p1 TRINITY_DN97515_c0_g1~~TRINITY_DN97515_c0_g1_i1.p1  ORF type:complete len:325 (+),score=59.86 TRINITY_DN97515_c0_g1_i1:27-1001(+)